MTRLVLDASADAELALNTTRARSLPERFPPSAEWWVPEHYFVEAAGALRRAGLDSSATPPQVDRAFVMLERAVLRRAEVRPLLADASNRRVTLTVADALYVVLAEHLGATLVTFDERLARSPGLTISTITRSERSRAAQSGVRDVESAPARPLRTTRRPAGRWAAVP